jgi:hypothetical protein
VFSVVRTVHKFDFRLVVSERETTSYSDRDSCSSQNLRVSQRQLLRLLRTLPTLCMLTALFSVRDFNHNDDDNNKVT